MKADFTRKLLIWNKSKNNRTMPWKGEKDPYKIWLSEIILQQTRVEQGWLYYEKFIKTFPTIQQLAKAPEKKIFKMWEGLGYYTRCKNIIETAKKISNSFKGKFPSTYAEIKKLKGVGPYTAAAIASFAFNEPKAVVDGNVQRIIARYFGITTPVDTSGGKKIFQEMAEALLDSTQPGVYNQAIMDFGASVCKPKNPLCNQCIQRKECMAYKLNQVVNLPVKEKAIIKKDRWFYYFIIQFEGKVYIRKRTSKDIWQNLHEFVLLETKKPLDDSLPGNLFFKNLLGKQSFSINYISNEFRQQLTHQNIYGQFMVVTISKPLYNLKNYILVEKQKLKQYAFPRFINRFLEQATMSILLF